MSGPTPEALDYAPAPAGRTRRKVMRLVLITVALLLMVVGAMNYRRLWSGIKLKHGMWAEMRQYDAAASYTAPADRVVRDGAAAPIAAAAVPRIRNWPTPGSGAVVFMHERATPKPGNQCLVLIEFVPGRSGHGPHLSATLIERGSLSKWLRHNGPMVALEDDELLRDDPPLRLYAGQIDPADDSHFTIRYQTATRSGTLDGWLDPPPPGAGAWEFGTIRMRRRDDAQ